MFAVGTRSRNLTLPAQVVAAVLIESLSWSHTSLNFIHPSHFTDKNVYVDRRRYTL